MPGAGLAFDGEQLIVTQTSRNLERMRVILRNYNEVKQVEIESKFLEVQQGDLEELGFDWTVGDGQQFIVDGQGKAVLDQYGNPTYNNSRQFSTQNRNLNDAFKTGNDASSIRIIDENGGRTEVPNPAPLLTSAIDLAGQAANVFNSDGWTVAGADVDLAIRALSRKTGSDLMSAPKVTVLSGKRATITVAQELRYPESYGDIESEAPSGEGAGSGDFDHSGYPARFRDS